MSWRKTLLASTIGPFRGRLVLATTKLQGLVLSPMGRRILWVGFAILFFQSGLAFTTWLIEPEQFEGGIGWLWVALFPILLPAFFLVNRHLGCASGACSSGQCELPAGEVATRAGMGRRETESTM